MSNVVLVARCVVAAILAAAGAAKVLDRAGTRVTLQDFGIPAPLVGAGSVVLPGAELATAVLVLVPTTSWWGGLVALVLLAGFTVVIAVNLGRGRTPDCHCFGRLAPSAIGRGTIVRNVLFCIPALVVVLFA